MPTKNVILIENFLSFKIENNVISIQISSEI